MTSWTLHDPMFHDLRGHCSFPSTIILGFALLAWLFLLSGRLFHIGFDERWRRRFLFFHLFDPSQSDTKPFLRLFQCLTQFLVLFSQLGRFFFCHDPSLSERSSLNSYEEKWSILVLQHFVDGYVICTIYDTHYTAHQAVKFTQPERRLLAIYLSF